MVNLYDLDELDLTGLNIDAPGWSGRRIRIDYGGGRSDVAVIDGTAGLHRWTVSAGVWPDNTGYNAVVGSDAWMEYYFEFFKSHTVGSQHVFIIEWRGDKYTACFANPDVSFEQHTSDLFTPDGIEIMQQTVAGVVYNADGTIFYPDQMTGVRSWYRTRSTSSMSAFTSEITANPYPLAAAATQPTITTNGSIPVVRWDGSSSKALVGSDAYTFTHLMMTACAQEATFASSPVRGLVSGETLDILCSEVSTTKFADIGYAADFEYKKNGTALADANAQCSMSNALAVLECKFPNQKTLDGLIIGRRKVSTTTYWKGDMHQIVIVDNASMSSADEYKLRRFLANTAGGITVIE